MPTDKLTDSKIRQAKPPARPYKLFDGGGYGLESLTLGLTSYSSDIKIKTEHSEAADIGKILP